MVSLDSGEPTISKLLNPMLSLPTLFLRSLSLPDFALMCLCIRLLPLHHTPLPHVRQEALQTIVDLNSSMGESFNGAHVVTFCQITQRQLIQASKSQLAVNCQPASKHADFFRD